MRWAFCDYCANLSFYMKDQTMHHVNLWRLLSSPILMTRDDLATCLPHSLSLNIGYLTVANVLKAHYASGSQHKTPGGTLEKPFLPLLRQRWAT